MKVIRRKIKDITPNLWEGGKTYEFFIYPENTSYAERNFVFRLSSATLEKSPSAFTNFQGYRRFLVMLTGDLVIERNGCHEQHAQGDVFAFSSSDSITSFSTGIDFNLMIDQQAATPFINTGALHLQIKEKFCFVYTFSSTSLTINQRLKKLDENECLIFINPHKKEINLNGKTNFLYGYWS